MPKKFHITFDDLEHHPEISLQNAQEKILLLLMYNPAMTFNQLWNKEGRSNRFAYHLKTLEKKELLEKNKEGKYQLTLEGKKEVVYINRNSGKTDQFPIIAVVTVITHNGQFLMLHRSKEPFHGYWGFHGGKLESTHYILEQAEDSIKEETGLRCDLKLKGLFSSKTYVDNKLAYNHQLFIVEATNPQGTLLKSTKKGENKWVKKDNVKKLKILPNIPLLIKIATGKKFRWIEADRIQDENQFKLEIKKDLVL